MQRIDLTRLRTTANIHKLLQMLGMPENCHDNDSQCPTWKAQGECERNPTFMLQACRLSCGTCQKKNSTDNDTACVNTSPDHDCEYWSTMGECTANEVFMSKACAKSCGVCTTEDTFRGEDEEEEDDDKDEL